MTPTELKAYCDEISEFCKANELRDHPTKYFEFRKKLAGIASDATLENAVRIDASIVQRTLSWMFNSITGAQMKERISERLKDYPESQLYSPHDSLTSKCRAKVIQMASNFEFKPTPLVLGIKHYYGESHGA